MRRQREGAHLPRNALDAPEPADPQQNLLVPEVHLDVPAPDIGLQQLLDGGIRIETVLEEMQEQVSQSAVKWQKHESVLFLVRYSILSECDAA